APASRYEEVVRMVADTIGSAPQGDPLNESTVFGPVASAAQFDTVMEYIASGTAEGARLVTGGARHGTVGHFIQPTVFADVTEDMRISREEIFGPVICILRYDDGDPTHPDVTEAIRLANNTEFGLGGIVFGADAERAQSVAEQMDTGSVGVNFFGSNHSAPFGGRHDSGLGIEYGIEGLSQYVTYQSVHRRH
ncbi:MAG: aldehyde dehydrogenase family protein, partial [Micrococcaceae bacterium]